MFGAFTLHSGWLVLLAAMLVTSVAQADIVASASQPFAEPSGFYSGVKSVTVYTHDDPGNPQPGAAGELTYVYSVSNDATSMLGLIGFNLDAPIGSVVSAGWIPDADPLTPPPSAVINNNDGVVRWDWAVATGIISPGLTGELLYIVSHFTPGSINDNIYSIEGDFAFDVEGTFIGPWEEPVAECDLQIVKDGCVVQPPPPPGDACEGKLKCFEFEYTGLGCDASSNIQDPKKTLCLGGADGAEPVDIVVYGRKHKRRHGWWGWWNKRKSHKTFASFTDVNVGDRLEVCADHGGQYNFGPSTGVKIKTGSGYRNTIEFDKFHTSCSQPFGPGMQFGSLLITSVTSTRGGTVTLPEDPPEEECVTEIDVTAPPHCLGDIQQLVLRYVGGDCTGSMNSQDPAYWECSDASPAGTSPVRVIVSDGVTAPPSTNAYVDQSPVVIGDLITINASDAGHSYLTCKTGYWIKNAADDTLHGDGYFKTSCSQPLNLGDQFGPLQVYSMTTTQGGTVSLEHEIEYTYEVTNPNEDLAINIDVDDDKLGSIVSGASIPAGETVTYTATGFISETTTNVATLTGEVNGVTCNPAESEATITVVEPPPAGDICTTAVQAMRLRYEGPEILGVRVELEASRFSSETVVYDPIDLIPGVTELALPSENGFSIDATAHGEIELGSYTRVKIYENPCNPSTEKIHTGCNCSIAFEEGKPAPLYQTCGGECSESTTWSVVSFTQRE